MGVPRLEMVEKFRGGFEAQQGIQRHQFSPGIGSASDRHDIDAGVVSHPQIMQGIPHQQGAFMGNPQLFEQFMNH